MSGERMKAFSILQPWAWLIVRPDLADPVARAAAAARRQIKDVENRDWRTSFRGRFLVHTGKRWGPEQRDDLARIRAQFPHIPLPDRFDLGGIVGAATMVDCVDTMNSPWFFGEYGFVLKDAEPCNFIAWRGELGWFDIPRSALPHLSPEMQHV